jgi:VWFA-related protein
MNQRGVAGLSAVLLLFCGQSIAQNDEQSPPPQFKIGASFVWVPTLVRTESGATVPDVKADEFRLWDNDIPQTVVPVKTADLPVSLVILMQTGGSAARYLSSYANLPSMLGHLVGDSVEEITFATFDSHIDQIWHFPVQSDGVKYALTHQHAGDQGASIRDAADFAVWQLQGEPGRFRRIVLLISEGTDRGSVTSSQALIEQLGMASTVVYSVVFPGVKTNSKRKANRERTNDHDWPSDRLDSAIRALDAETAAELAALTGGSSVKFDDQRSFNSGLLQIADHIRATYTLGFQPTADVPGLHNIRVEIALPKLNVTARGAYWRPPAE